MTVVKVVLILSHGNASVERGFSVNKDILIENLSEQSLISQRLVYDKIKDVGGIFDVNIDKNLMRYVKGSRMRYERQLEQKKGRKLKRNKKLWK